MKKVIGDLNFNVEVECPECSEDFDLNDIEDDENKLGKALFGRRDKPANWENIGAVYKCPKCGEDFELEKIEY